MDRADRDPALTATELEGLEFTLRKLFCEAYILLRPPPPKDPAAPQGEAANHELVAPQGLRANASLESTGGPLTLTSVVCDQLEDMVEYRYGPHSHVLFRRCDRHKVQESLASQASVVEDCLDRMRADFANQDLYMCFGAMDLRSWQALKKGAESDALALREKARRLCEALGATYTWETWKAALRFLNRQYRRREDAATVDNRVLWAAALRAPPLHHGGSHPLLPFQKVVEVYVALTDGTGSVERSLGAHACFLDHHQGSADTFMSEVCLEICRDGPSEEPDLFKRVDGGHLWLNGFSRRCAELWRAHVGRRFACYKERSDKGKRQTGWRLRGSAKAVELSHAEGTRSLATLARADGAAPDASLGDSRQTLVGVSRGRVVCAMRRREAPPATKLLTKFRKTTANRKSAKAKSGTWMGLDSTKPKLLKEAGATTGMTMIAAPPPAAPGPRPLAQIMWRGRRRSAVGAAAAPAPKRRRHETGTQQELYQEKLDGQQLMTWTEAILLGGETRSQPGRGKHLSSSAHDAAIHRAGKVYFEPTVVRKYPRLVKCFRAAVQRRDSKWQEVHTSGGGSHCIGSLEDCQAVLRKVRRLKEVAGVHASFLRPRCASSKLPAASTGNVQPGAAIPRRRWHLWGTPVTAP